MKTKLAIVIFSLLLLVGLAGTFGSAQIVEAASSIWNSCQRGEVNCPYPGECHSYVDTNGDRICDLSQSDPSASVTTEAAASSSIISGPDSADLSVSTAVAPAAVTPTASAAVTDTSAAAAGAQAVKLKNSYYFLPIFLVLAVLYALTWALAAGKIIKIALHRKIWNFVLLISMIVSALLGLFLILNSDFNFNISLPLNMLFWHVEAGIALGVIGAFHIFWHWRYFAKLLKSGEKSVGRPV